MLNRHRAPRRRSIWKTITRFPTCFTLPAVVVLAAIILFPTLYLLWMSVTHWVILEPVRYFNGLANYLHLLRAPDFWASIRVTSIYIVSTAVLSTVVGLLLALSLRRGGHLGGVIRALIILPLVVPPIVAGFAWKFLLNREIGLLGSTILPRIGITEGLLASPDLAIIGVVIADTWSKSAFMFLITLAALQSIPDSLYEAARIDGASPWQELRSVTLPLLLPAITVAVFFRAIDAINTFDLIYVMTQGGPGTATQTMSILGWKTAFTAFDLGRSGALAVILMLITLTLTNVLAKRVLK